MTVRRRSPGRRRLAGIASVVASATGTAFATIGAVGTLGTSACASPGLPPGGPPDSAAPRLVRITPDSGATNVRPRAIELQFDEVVAEVPSGAASSFGAPSAGGGSFTGTSGSASLAGIVLLSPRAGALTVEWRRDRVTVRPRDPLRPNTTYTLTILPGLADLRQNVRDTAIVRTFSTGPTLATARLGGIVFDWVGARPAGRAVVEAVAPDSTTYYTVADSVGRFTIPNLPPATYLVRGFVDANGNRDLDPREPFDTVRASPPQLASGDSARIELLAFVHDTVGPRIGSVTLRDSVTVRITFDRPLADSPLQALPNARFRVVTRDSTAAPIRAVYPAALFDSLDAARRKASADSAAREAAARDTTRRAAPPPPTVDTVAARRDTLRGRRPAPPPPPKPSRPSPVSEVTLVLAQPLRPQTQYRVVAIELRGLAGATTPSSERAFSTPRAAPPADTTRRAPAPRDTVGTPR